jgi:hypothetical protein
VSNRNETRDRYTEAGKNMLKAVAKLAKKPYVKVGFVGQKAEKVHKRDTGKVSQARLVRDLLRTMGAELKPEPDPLTIVENAIIHEFGSQDGRIPERGPIRATHDKKQRQWWEVVQKLKTKILTLQMNIPRALGLLGETIKADIQSAYRAGGDPYVPNKPSTIAAKGSSKPLIDTAQTINAVTYERVNAD